MTHVVSIDDGRTVRELREDATRATSEEHELLTLEGRLLRDDELLRSLKLEAGSLLYSTVQLSIHDRKGDSEVSVNVFAHDTMQTVRRKYCDATRRLPQLRASLSREAEGDEILATQTVHEAGLNDSDLIYYNPTIFMVKFKERNVSYEGAGGGLSPLPSCSALPPTSLLPVPSL